jgi:hypothetical protein
VAHEAAAADTLPPGDPDAARAPRLLVAGEPLTIRASAETDRAYVLSTWVESYRQHAGVSRGVYLSEQPRLAERLYRDHGALVVCSERRPSTIHAWACMDGALLHFAYTAPGLRRNGLLRALVVAALGEYPARIEVTHRPAFGSTRLVHNPYRLARAA